MRYKIQQVKQSTVTDVHFVAEEREVELDTDEEAIALGEAELASLPEEMTGSRVVRINEEKSEQNNEVWDEVAAFPRS